MARHFPRFPKFLRWPIDAERSLVLLMLGSAIFSFIVPLPVNLDTLLISAHVELVPASYVEVMIKASIIGLALSFAVVTFIEKPRRSPLGEDVLVEEGFSRYRLPFTGQLMKVLYSLLQSPVDTLLRWMPGLREQLLKSRMNISPYAYVTLLLVATFFSTPLSVIGALLFIWFRFMPFILLITAPAFVFLIGLQLPKMSQSSRAGALDHEIPYMIGYINVLASAGISPVIAMRKLSRFGGLFPAAAGEARRILRDIDIFGHDPLTAFEKVAKFNPNRMFADFFAGYSLIIKTGGDIVSYIDLKLRETFAYRELRIRASAGVIGMLAEAYIAVTVVLGIVVFVLFAMQSMMGAGGTINPAALQSSVLFSTVVVPMISIMFIYIIHSMQPKQPLGYTMAYRVFVASTLAIPLMLLLPLVLPLYIRLGVGMIGATIPAAVLTIRETTHRRGVERMLPSFVVDISEVRKTGLSPERGIEQLATRSYGQLTKHVKAMSAQLSWGVSLEKVLNIFTLRVRSWTVRAIAFLILEVVAVGGGTVKMFNNVAEFTQRVYEMDREHRSMLRPYVFIPYFGAIMIVVTTVVMMHFLTMPIGTLRPMVTKEALEGATEILFSGALIQSWTMGFVAGKMGEGSLASGFKHAAAIVAVSLVTISGITSVLAGM